MFISVIAHIQWWLNSIVRNPLSYYTVILSTKHQLDTWKKICCFKVDPLPVQHVEVVIATKLYTSFYHWSEGDKNNNI